MDSEKRGLLLISETCYQMVFPKAAVSPVCLAAVGDTVEGSVAGVLFQPLVKETNDVIS